MNAILYVAVIAPNMDLSELVLHHTRVMQEYLLERGVFPLAHGLNLADVSVVSDRARPGAICARALFNAVIVTVGRALESVKSLCALRAVESSVTVRTCSA